MNWLRDKLRAWLRIESFPFASIQCGFEEVHRREMALRTDLDALKGEVRAREPRPQQVSFRITVDDFETSQLKALDEFKDQKGSD